MTDELPDRVPPDPAPLPSRPLPEGALRVGDADRYQAATALGEHFATGRLDQQEYDDRVKDAYAARTRGDLERLFTDLPEPAPYRPRPVPAGSGWEAGRTARDRSWRGPRGDFRRAPVLPVVAILAIFVGVSLVARFPVFPLLFLLWFGVGRRAWR